jgi:tetratricopeptide (TPR) repeat protein
MSEIRYKAFISYSHQDERWAAWLQRALESYHLPRKLVGGPGRHGEIPARINPVFRDREDLSAAGDLNGRIIRALENSDSIIVICSPFSAQSRWVNEEIRQFIAMGKGDRVYCLIVDGDPQAETGEGGCFPPALFEQQSMEPLAADSRKWADGKRLAMLKIVSGILGIRLDDLRQRDLQRQRKIRLVSGLAIVAALSLAIFSIVSEVSRQNEREKAEQMAGFIVDLGERLQSTTDLETLALINEQASKHFENLDPDDLSLETGTKVALTLRQMGRVSELQGRLVEALEVFQRSRDLFQTLEAKYPGQPELLYELSNAEYYIGNYHLELGAYEPAREAFRNSHRLTEKLMAAAPENPAWIMERSYSHNNLAAVQLASGQGVDHETLEHLEDAIALIERAMQLEPDNRQYASHYAVTLAWAADAQYQACRIDTAMSMRFRVRQLAEKAALADPGNRALERRHAYAISGVSAIQAHAGQLERAEENLVLSIAMLQQMAAADPSNLLYRFEIVEREFRLARLMAEQGRLEEASMQMSAIEPGLRPDARSPTKDDDAMRVYIDFLLAGSNIALQLGQVAEADKKIRQALELQLAEPDEDSGDHARWSKLVEMQFQWWEIHGSAGGDGFPAIPDIIHPGEEILSSCEDLVNQAKLAVIRGDREGAAQAIGHLQQKGFAEPGFIRFCRKYGFCSK